MRDNYYDLDERGTLSIDGVVQDDPWFVDFFFRRLAPNANPDYTEFPYVCRCGDEMNYLRVRDTPIVFTRLEGERLIYGHSLSVHFEPEKLGYSSEGVLYHAAPLGMWGRIVPHVAVELASYIEPWGPYYAFKLRATSTYVPLQPLALVDEIQLLRPKSENGCVGCGLANPHSLRQTFVRFRSDGTIRTWIRPDERMQGAMGTTHGGFVSLLLDEVMGKALSVRGIKAPTAKLQVDFRKPMMLHEQYELRSWIETQQGRKQFVKAEVRLACDDNILIAEASGLFIALHKPY